MGYSDRVRVSYAYRYYEGTNSSTKPVNYWLSNEFRMDGTTPLFDNHGENGVPLFLKVTLTFRESNNLNAKTIATFEKECRVFSSGEIKYTVQTRAEASPATNGRVRAREARNWNTDRRYGSITDCRIIWTTAAGSTPMTTPR